MSKYIIFYITLFILSSCGKPSTESTKVEKDKRGTSVALTDAQLKNSEITSAKIQKRSISSVLKVNGTIEVPPQNLVSVSVALGGYLKSSKLLAGMQVRKGEVIATLEDIQYIELQQEYLTAKAHFTSIEKEFMRQKELNQSKASSDKVYEAAQTEYTSQKVKLKSLEEKLKLINVSPDKLDESTISRSINVHSPIDGFVSSVNQNIGKYVTPTDVLFELINPSDIHLVLTVFEKDVARLSTGQKLLAYNNTYPDKKHPCEIILIGKHISSERTVQVQCQFNQYDKNLLPGMYMNAEIEVATEEAFAIPTDGIVRFEGKHYVFTQTDRNTFEMCAVSAENTESGYTQISFADQSAMGDKTFVTHGAYTLLMKMKNQEEE